MEFGPVLNDSKHYEKISPEWSKIKEVVLESNPELLTTMMRQMKMQHKNNKDFLMKLKLLNRHPSILQPTQRQENHLSQEGKKLLLVYSDNNNSPSFMHDTSHHNHNNNNQNDNSNQQINESGLMNIGRVKRQKRLKAVGAGSIYVEDKGEDQMMHRLKNHKEISKEQLRNRRIESLIKRSKHHQNCHISMFDRRAKSQLKLMNRTDGNDSFSPLRSASKLKELVQQKNKENDQMMDFIEMDQEEVKKDIERREAELAVRHQRITKTQIQRLRHEQRLKLMKGQNQSQDARLKMRERVQTDMNPNLRKRGFKNDHLPAIMIDDENQDINQYDLLDQDLPVKPQFQDSLDDEYLEQQQQLKDLEIERRIQSSPPAMSSDEDNRDEAFKKRVKQIVKYNNLLLAKTQDRFLDRLAKQSSNSNLDDVISLVEKEQNKRLPLLPASKKFISDFVIMNDMPKSSRNATTSQLNLKKNTINSNTSTTDNFKSFVNSNIHSTVQTPKIVGNSITPRLYKVSPPRNTDQQQLPDAFQVKMRDKFIKKSQLQYHKIMISQ
ncbi:UNKNOWN [Stylonychia lemnae]|uniref:Uncharacterized protein n=1 Tax=Stylonychia lemnae TaxID=5949 RepID=A0A078AUZ2_STYLE|nr:UNKNOWN [Stylonychia lemnae]|eukprot:CDW86024.1 UNKNOWN [Stylonychia lemnae]